MAQKTYDFRDNLPPYDVEDPMDLAMEIENIETRLNLISPESTEWQTLEEERVLKTARHTQLCFITNYGEAYGYHEAEVPIPGNITLTVDSPIEHFIQYERYKSSISRECSRMCDFLLRLVIQCGAAGLTILLACILIMSIVLQALRSGVTGTVRLGTLERLTEILRITIYCSLRT